MDESLADLLLLLDLEPIDTNIFRGANRDEPRRAVFGGLVAAQALMAAGRTVAPNLPPHSLHAYFLRPGNPALPILYEVERIRDGKSFTTRCVVAVQKGEAIFSMSASFHQAEAGFEHQDDMPTVPPPSLCQTQQQYLEANKGKLPPFMEAWITRPRPVELRPTEPVNMVDPKPQSATQRNWIRAMDTLPDDPLIHACVATYASDMSLLGSALRPHGRTFWSSDVMAASLDHALWFHVPFRMDQWLLYDQRSTRSSGGRGYAVGRLFTQSGELVASVAQEGMMRRVTPR